MTLRFFLYLFFIIFLVTALAIPVAFQSMTLWYKFGVDRILLQGAQFAGMIAFALLYLQVVLSTRGEMMENAFGVARLMRWHKLNGVLILALAATHILLVLLPEGLSNLPLGFKFWAEMIGLALFLALLFIVLTSWYRQQFKLAYGKWKIIHRPLGYLVIVLVSSHVLFVSDSFENMQPRLFLTSSFLGLLAWVSLVKWSAFKQKNN